MLSEHGPAIAKDYVQRRGERAGHRFHWPRRDGVSLSEVVRDALAAMTDEHCAYCDGSPIDAMGEKQIDHFRPKTDPRFLELVCEWTNLFLSCMRCNRAKREQWEEELLRPDDEDYRFERYFEYRSHTGELQPNPAASPEDQARARTTIDILELNRADACKLRVRTVRALLRGDDEPGDLPYRFLVPLTTPAR